MCLSIVFGCGTNGPHGHVAPAYTPIYYLLRVTDPSPFPVVYWFLEFDGIRHLLTQWSRVLPEKLKRPELLKKFSAFMEPEGS
jgi:hypothetical protein